MKKRQILWLVVLVGLLTFATATTTFAAAAEEVSQATSVESKIPTLDWTPTWIHLNYEGVCYQLQVPKWQADLLVKFTNGWIKYGRCRNNVGVLFKLDGTTSYCGPTGGLGLPAVIGPANNTAVIVWMTLDDGTVLKFGDGKDPSMIAWINRPADSTHGWVCLWDTEEGLTQYYGHIVQFKAHLSLKGIHLSTKSFRPQPPIGAPK